MHPKFLSLTLAAASWLTCACPAQAMLLVSEYFDYANYGTSINGATGGTGWSGAWVATDTNGTLTVTDNTLVAPAGYGETVESAILKITPANGKNKDGYRLLADAIDLGATVDTTYYFSYLWARVDNPSAAGEASYFSLRDSSGATLLNFGVDGTEKLYIQATTTATGGTQNVGAQGTDTLNIQNNFNTTGKYLIVGKMEINASGDDVFSLSIYNSTDTLTGEPALWSVTLSVDASGEAARLALFANAYGQDSYFDNILIGTTFADVTAIPEPSVATVFLGLGALGFAVARRRR